MIIYLIKLTSSVVLNSSKKTHNFFFSKRAFSLLPKISSLHWVIFSSLIPVWTLKQQKTSSNMLSAKNLIKAVLPTPDQPINMIGSCDLILWMIKHILKKLSKVMLYSLSSGYINFSYFKQFSGVVLFIAASLLSRILNISLFDNRLIKLQISISC